MADDGVDREALNIGLSEEASGAGLPAPPTIGSLAGNPTRRHPGMIDVAEVAGVSYQTVSRVVNNLPDVSASTRAKVLAAIEQLGYRRNSAARALKTRRSTTLGIISGASPRLGPVRTLVELESAAREAGYGSNVVTVREPYAHSVPEAMGSLEELGVDGIIVVAPRIGLATAVRETRVRVPVVMIAAGEAGTPGVFTYSEDQERGARMATRHLLDLGHTDIAHLAGSMDWFDGRVRKRGWEAEMRSAGLEPRTCLIGNWTPKWAYQTGLRFVAEGVPGAIFAASDHTALGLFRAFAENGVKVPGDVSVVGFDDIEGAEYFYPPLTTIRQNFAALARRSIALLLRAGEDSNADLTPIVPVLKVRASTGPA